MDVDSEWQDILTLVPARGSEVLQWKGGYIYHTKWVHSEAMGPVWATPDGHVLFNATHWRPVLAPPAERAPPGPVNCTHVLRREGKAYPRTCARCGLGPCPFYAKEPQS